MGSLTDVQERDTFWEDILSNIQLNVATSSWLGLPFHVRLQNGDGNA